MARRDTGKPATKKTILRPLQSNVIFECFPPLKCYPELNRAQKGYGGFSVSRSAFQSVMTYISRQKEYHKKYSFEDEPDSLIEKWDLQWRLSCSLWTENF
ncbi:hypothetical protein SCG7086_BL_00040 [Chlamydiales bacterium SCGC AG-110-P3]|nr:hypothetical protein SCG7086_BL_00040 [Chlamydiales bacterium SCGC AG-110-P3]